MTDHRPEQLQERVQAWLATEGYPTEFRAASTFQRHGFRVHQGEHVRDDEGGNPREIDIYAHKTSGVGKPFSRVAFVAECKWSGDKPWVVFTTGSSRMSPSACIAQTIGSELGSTALWLLAGDRAVQDLPLFETPARAGFGGRQAFSKGNDQFFAALSSVTNAATTLAAGYDRGRRPGRAPEAGVCIFPIVVVEGQLFRAFFNSDSGEVEVEPAPYIRCHWRGAATWRLHATIDVVSLAYLDTYLADRSDGVGSLLEKLESAGSQIAECFESRSLEGLKVAKGSRGITGMPRLLHEAVGALDV